MKVLIAGGGTAGHVNPALAIASTLKKKEKNVEILFVGAKGGMEEGLVEKAGYPFCGIHVKGFQRKISIPNLYRNAKALLFAFTSQIEAKKILKQFKPDIAIGTGGYVSGPVILTATKMKIKTVIHEQNAFPGMTTKLLEKKVDKVMVAVPQSLSYFENKDNCAVVGNPIRSEIIYLRKDECRKALKIGNRKMVLSFGGSLGAAPINNAVAHLMDWYQDRDDIYHIHGTGKTGYQKFLDYLHGIGVDETKRKNIEIREYIDNMPELLTAADLVISRAGAVTISEIEAAGKASILIPSPYVAENHQYHNAMVLSNRNAAVVIEEKDLTPERLIKEAEAFLENKEKLESFSKRASEGAILDTNDRIYDIIKDLVR